MISQARLFIGDPLVVQQRVITLLQKECNGCACGVCGGCRRIAERRDWRVLWFEESTKDALDELLERCVYQSGGVTQYLVLCDVDTLSARAAARLLKDLEEPPAGYHFILTAATRDRVLPTIRSRCHTEHCASSADREVVHWAASLTRDTFVRHAQKNSDAPEDMLREIDAIQRALSQAYIQANTLDERARIVKMLAVVHTIGRISPMPGTNLLLMRALMAALAVV